MPTEKEKLVTSGTGRTYAIVPSSSAALLSRDELRAIDRYVDTRGATGGRVAGAIPALPFQRVQGCQDERLGLRVCAVSRTEPALDVPLRFATPEAYRLPPLQDPPARLPFARRVGALIKGSESVAVSWTVARRDPPADAAVPTGAEGGATAATLRDAEARAQSAVRRGDAEQAALLFAALAALQYNCGNMEVAAAAFTKALALFESTDSAQGVAFCHNLCGHCNFRLGEFKVALVHYKKLEALGESYVRCVARVNMGVTYGALGEHAFAVEALEDALGSAREVSGEPMLETIVLGDLGIASVRVGNMRAGQTHLEGCLEQCSLAGDKSGAALCLLLLGHVYTAIHDYTHAVFYYEHAYRVGGEAGLPDVVAAARVNYGVARGSAALRETVLAEAAAMGQTNDIASIINALPP